MKRIVNNKTEKEISLDNITIIIVPFKLKC